MNIADTYKSLFTNDELYRDIPKILMDNINSLLNQTTTNGIMDLTITFNDNSVLNINK